MSEPLMDANNSLLSNEDTKRTSGDGVAVNLSLEEKHAEAISNKTDESVNHTHIG